MRARLNLTCVHARAREGERGGTEGENTWGRRRARFESGDASMRKGDFRRCENFSSARASTARRSNISPVRIDRCFPAGWRTPPPKYCLPGNYVCHVCPFARFISHHPSAFTFHARTLLFFRLKLAYGVRAYRNANAASMPRHLHPPEPPSCATKIPHNTRPRRGGVSPCRRKFPPSLPPSLPPTDPPSVPDDSL